jgi:hypothetical protein
MIHISEDDERFGEGWLLSGSAQAREQTGHLIISTATDSVDRVKASGPLGAFCRWLCQRGWHAGYDRVEVDPRPAAPYLEARFADGPAAEQAIVASEEDISTEDPL